MLSDRLLTYSFQLIANISIEITIEIDSITICNGKKDSIPTS